MHESILAYRSRRFLWLALLLIAASLAAYLWHRPTGPANGGTWLGYTLGGIGAALILWLTALGVRKRSYRSNLGTVQGWVSAHVYLGLALIVVVTLHTGFQFGWNIHTLCYVLTCAVIATGSVGVVLYLSYPRQLSSNQAGLTLSQMLTQVHELDERCIKVAGRLPGEYADILKSNRDRTMLGGGVWAVLSARDRSQVLLPTAVGAMQLSGNDRQTALLEFLGTRLSQSAEGSATQALTELLSMVTARRSLLERLLRHTQLKAWLEVWLFLHVPLTVALLASVIAHVFSVFYYW